MTPNTSLAHDSPKHWRNRKAIENTTKRVKLTPTNQTFTGQVLVLPLSICRKLGKSSALFLQQLHYWTKRGQGVEVDGATFIYNSYEGWLETLGGVMSISSIRRAVKKLQEDDLIEVRQFGGCHRINYYRINYDALSSYMTGKIEQNSQSDVLKMNSPSVQNEQMINIDTKITNLNNSYKSVAKAAPLGQRVEIIDLSVFKENKLGELKVDHHGKKAAENARGQGRQNNLKAISNAENTRDNAGNPKLSTAHELIAIWNNTVGEITHKAALTKDRARYLIRAFIDKFDQDIQAWTSFCEALTRSDFLMGKVKESFKATLDWVLQFSTLQKIFEGAYGVNYISQNAMANRAGGDTSASLSILEYHKFIDDTALDQFDAVCKKKILNVLVEAGELNRYHFNFHKVRHHFKRQRVEMRKGYVEQIVCQPDGYVPFYEEAFTDLFSDKLSLVVDLPQLTREQIVFERLV